MLIHAFQRETNQRSQGLIAYILGWELEPSVRLWLTPRVNQTHIASLYSVMSVVGALGELAEAPLLGATFSAGLGLGRVGSGLPFSVAGGLCAFASASIWWAKWR